MGVLDIDKQDEINRLWRGFMPKRLPAMSPIVPRMIEIVVDALNDVFHI